MKRNIAKRADKEKIGRAHQKALDGANDDLFMSVNLILAAQQMFLEENRNVCWRTL